MTPRLCGFFLVLEEILSFLRVTQPAVVNPDLTSKGPVLIASLLYSSSSQDPVYSCIKHGGLRMEKWSATPLSPLPAPTHGFATARTLQEGESRKKQKTHLKLTVLLAGSKICVCYLPITSRLCGPPWPSILGKWGRL